MPQDACYLLGSGSSKGDATLVPRLVEGPVHEEKVDASIVIVTRDRASEAGRAVASALRQEGCKIEVIVVDDGSTDGTADLLCTRFPEARVYRNAVPRGYIERRNFAASVARGEFLFSIDDDAELTDPTTVAVTVRDFDAGNDIAAVAVPYRELATDGNEIHCYFTRSGRVDVVGQFTGCAYAIRRELFVRIGGFGEHLFYMGEERDLAVRLLQDGYFVRLGSAPPLVHRPSPVRNVELMVSFQRRNDILFAWQRAPARALPVHLIRTTLGGLLAAARLERGHYVGDMLRGIARGWRDVSHVERAPVDWIVYSLSLRLRRKGPMPLASARALLRRPHGFGPTRPAPGPDGTSGRRRWAARVRV